MRNLIIVGHPNYDTGSIANKKIIKELETRLTDASYINLSSLYPTFQIDVKAEQERLREAHNIVFEFPFYWYSMPGILKCYLDSVFTHGFAHGLQAVLSGKNLIYSFTTGAKDEEYAYGQAMNHPLSAFLTPFCQTAALCKLKFYEVHSCGMMYVPGISSDADRIEVENKAQDHAARLIKLLEEI